MPSTEAQTYGGIGNYLQQRGQMIQQASLPYVYKFMSLGSDPERWAFYQTYMSQLQPYAAQLGISHEWINHMAYSNNLQQAHWDTATNSAVDSTGRPITTASSRAQQ